jgi:peptidyl-prolyl cis-trans isomerase C
LTRARGESCGAWVRGVVPAGWVLAACFAAAESRAADADRRAQVAVRVGDVAISVGEIEDRIAAMPPVQRATFGSTAAEIARRFVGEVVVREALLDQRAAAIHAAEQPPTSYALDRARATSAVRAIRAREGAPSSISVDDVRAYYDEHHDQFSSPARYAIAWILCKTKDEARAVLDAAKADPKPGTFAALARDHSVDKGTSMRSGDLGFVGEDGSTPEPGLRVDRAVVEAVSKVKDGDLVPNPVAVGENFAVAWRRGTRPAYVRSMTEAAPSIRDTLYKQRIKTETDTLVGRLRGERLEYFDPEPLGTADIPPYKP